MTLEKGSKRGKYMRYFRAFLIGGTSASYLDLYKMDNEEYKTLIYPGILLSGVAISTSIPIPEVLMPVSV